MARKTFRTRDCGRFGRPLGFEPLEERRLLSVTVDLASQAITGEAAGRTPRFLEENASVISADGRYVAFVSNAPNLVDGVTIAPGVDNIYRYDRVTGEVELVSVGTAATESANQDCLRPVISADGNVIAFSSFSTNLHSLDTIAYEDVFVRDLTNGTTHLVSINLAGTGGGNRDSDYPAISADGTKVAFRSRSSNLDARDEDSHYDIYFRDLTTHSTQLVSVSVDGNGSTNRGAYSPMISADGSIVAYLTQSNNQHVLDTDIEMDLFARNVAQSVTYLVSVNAAGDGSANAPIATPTMSADGTRFAFQSRASNLHPLDTDLNYLDRSSDVFIRDIAAEVTHLVSINDEGTGSGNDESTDPSISADGNVVAYSSSASNLLPSVEIDSTNIFARNVETETTYLVSITTAGGGLSEEERSWDPKISADGNVVVFESDASNLHDLDVDIDPEDDIDIFARNLTTGTTLLISVNSPDGVAGNGPSVDPAVNFDGTVITFLSDAGDLVEHDFNSLQDVFVGSVEWAAPQLPGDYNQNGTVDAADYVVWRKLLGNEVANYAEADGDGNGYVEQSDHDVWVANFGKSLPETDGGSVVSDPPQEARTIETETPTIVVALPVEAQAIPGKPLYPKFESSNDVDSLPWTPTWIPLPSHYEGASSWSATGRSFPTASTRQDAALAAWSAKSSSTREVDSEVGEVGSYKHSAATDLYFESFDLQQPVEEANVASWTMVSSVGALPKALR